MQPINKQPMETPENNFYGVDVNNKAAVEAEYERLNTKNSSNQYPKFSFVLQSYIELFHGAELRQTAAV